MGGFYERIVGVVKRSMKMSLDRRCVSLRELQTVVAEVTAIVNSRPLVYPESDLSEPPLTPSHFLKGSRNALPSFSFQEDEYVFKRAKPDELLHLWRRTEAILDGFWHTWRNQYLLSLRTAPVTFKQRNVSDAKPEVGSIVLIKDNLQRYQWRIGRIVRLNIGSDGKHRSTIVQLANKKILSRLLRLLYPMELTANDPSETVNGNQQVSPTMGRPKRLAAREAASRIRQNLQGSRSPSESDSN